MNVNWTIALNIYNDSCQCQKCIDGFGAVTDPKTKIEVCVHCSLTNCKNCTGSDKEECTECLPGYYMYTDEDGKNKVCTGCRVENSQTCATGGLSCDVCIDKYYFELCWKMSAIKLWMKKNTLNLAQFDAVQEQMDKLVTNVKVDI